MDYPKVSVVIPAYKQADFLGETIQSVLDQTYPYFEVIVVNDASPDHTDQVVQGFDDRRLKYFTHPQNLGLPGARNTGIRNSSGELIALLDADDLYHPTKLESHVCFFEKHPGVDVTYNSRFELHHSARSIRQIWKPPLSLALSDFVLSFPFSPSDMVLRREAAFRVNLFDEKMIHGGEDLDFYLQLALTGSQFAGLERCLNYRRFHSARKKKNLLSRLEEYTSALEKAFEDPRCPEEVRDLRNQALTNHYLEVAATALIQEETDLAQKVLKKAIHLYPETLNGKPSELVRTLARYSILDEGQDHVGILERIFRQLPKEIAWKQDDFDWVVADGFLRRGFRNIVWGQAERGYLHIKKSFELGAKPEEPVLEWTIEQLSSFGTEFSLSSAEAILRNLTNCLDGSGFRRASRWLEGHYAARMAFTHYRSRNFRNVPSNVIVAMLCEPAFVANRGMLSIALKSVLAFMQTR